MPVDVLAGLTRYLKWHQNAMMTEFLVDGGRADIVFITCSGYLTKVEIKISVSDWKQITPSATGA